MPTKFTAKLLRPSASSAYKSSPPASSSSARSCGQAGKPWGAREEKARGRFSEAGGRLVRGCVARCACPCAAHSAGREGVTRACSGSEEAHAARREHRRKRSRARRIIHFCHSAPVPHLVPLEIYVERLDELPHASEHDVARARERREHLGPPEAEGEPEAG